MERGTPPARFGFITKAFAGLSIFGLVRVVEIHRDRDTPQSTATRAPNRKIACAERRDGRPSRSERDTGSDDRRGERQQRQPEAALDLHRQVEREAGAGDERGAQDDEGARVELAPPDHPEMPTRIPASAAYTSR